MYYSLNPQMGETETIIDDNCGISKFYAIANTLAERLHVKFLNQIDDADSLEWDFKYKDHFITLHYNIFNGVSIYPQQVKKGKQSSKVIMEVAKFLQRHKH
ncbi:MAG: hypothetical protein IT254_12045 [Chitinophagaceae bacterium]|nr:hypothetical protein [Bacteroidota bacterium]MCC6259048.1 hypothetical protein [Chitinophagaceae bacterium]MCW5917376.1 hypothetical protein [Ferruginibacter sp.]